VMNTTYMLYDNRKPAKMNSTNGPIHSMLSTAVSC
jgi:hypothetical protein